jgi:hypothetical protein
MALGRGPALERLWRHLHEPGPTVPAAERQQIRPDLVGRPARETDPGSLARHGDVFGRPDEALERGPNKRGRGREGEGTWI